MTTFRSAEELRAAMAAQIEQLRKDQAAEDKRRAEVLRRGDVEDALDRLASEFEHEPEEGAGIDRATGVVKQVPALDGYTEMLAVIKAAKMLADDYAMSDGNHLVFVLPHHHTALRDAIATLDTIAKARGEHQ